MADPAYPPRIYLQAPFRQRLLAPQMEAYNKSMNAIRCSFECVFGDIVNYFKFLDLKKKLKIGLPSRKNLQNALTYLYYNSTAQFFNLDPPTLQEYFV